MLDQRAYFGKFRNRLIISDALFLADIKAISDINIRSGHPFCKVSFSGRRSLKPSLNFVVIC